jgi:hypothetical protein
VPPAPPAPADRLDQRQDAFAQDEAFAHPRRIAFQLAADRVEQSQVAFSHRAACPAPPWVHLPNSALQDADRRAHLDAVPQVLRGAGHRGVAEIEKVARQDVLEHPDALARARLRAACRLVFRDAAGLAQFRSRCRAALEFAAAQAAGQLVAQPYPSQTLDLQLVAVTLPPRVEQARSAEFRVVRALRVA